MIAAAAKKALKVITPAGRNQGAGGATADSHAPAFLTLPTLLA